MDRVDWYMFRHEDPEARRRTESVRPGGLDPAHVMVNRMAEAMGRTLSPRQPHPAGIAMHYGLGIGPGALYGAFRDRVPALGAGRGLAYGLALTALEDELANRAMGLSAPLGHYPWQAHARGLVSHLVYGVVTDAVLRALQAGGGSRRQRREPPYLQVRRPASNRMRAARRVRERPEAAAGGPL